MSHKNCFSFLLLVFTVLIFGARGAQACSCAAKPTVLEQYDLASVIIITKAVSVEKAEKAPGHSGVRSTKMIVEKVFKGNLKLGDEITFAQGGGADCIWTFDEKDIDKQFLFYLNPTGKGSEIWIAGACGRSNVLEYAHDDLLYLNKLDKVRGKTRISGTVRFEKETDLSVEGRKLRIIGANKTYEVKTDKDGIYEIYDLPAGKYLIEPEIPIGWKLNYYELRYSSSFAGNEEEELTKKIPIILEDKKHAGLDIRFEIDNAIRGKLYDPTGKPMNGVCITALLTDQKGNGPFDCTEEDGSFAISELPSGSYILVINDDGKISSREPFKTFYYPKVFEREKAAVFTINEGVILEGINIYVPRMEEIITIEGVFLYSDGKPVIDESVEFKAEKTKEGIESDARATTDANGRFSIRILKGLKGKLYGGMYTYIGEYENCPNLESIIKKIGRTNTEIKTPAVEIQAENNLYGVELKYPFPSCKKAKED